MSITLTDRQAHQLELLELEDGGQTPDDADGCMCLMEAVALIAGEPRTTSPACADKTIAYMAVGINDVVDWTERQQYKTLVPHIIGTADDGLAVRRISFALRWAATELVPELLGRLGFWDRAEELTARREHLPLEPGEAWHPVLGLLEQARMVVRRHVQGGDWSALRDQEQEQIDVQNMIGRVIVALTDYVDPEFTPGEIDHIAGTLGQLFVVPLKYNWTPLQPYLSRFLAELVHTGRSTL